MTHLRQIMLEDYGAATTPSPPSTLTCTRSSISVGTSIVHPISLAPSIYSPVPGRVVHALEAGPEHRNAAFERSLSGRRFRVSVSAVCL